MLILGEPDGIPRSMLFAATPTAAMASQTYLMRLDIEARRGDSVTQSHGALYGVIISIIAPCCMFKALRSRRALRERRREPPRVACGLLPPHVVLG